MEFAVDTLQLYLMINESDNPNIDRLVSELEVITIGLLGIVSQLEGHKYTIILPQSYQIVSGLFNDMNTCNLLEIVSNDNGTETVWEILESLVIILLGEERDGSDGLLV